MLPDIITPVLVNLSEGENDKFLPYRSDDFNAEFNLAIERLQINLELRPDSCRNTKFSTTEHHIHKDTIVMLDVVNEKPKKPTDN